MKSIEARTKLELNKPRKRKGYFAIYKPKIMRVEILVSLEQRLCNVLSIWRKCYEMLPFL